MFSFFSPYVYACETIFTRCSLEKLGELDDFIISRIESEMNKENLGNILKSIILCQPSSHYIKLNIKYLKMLEYFPLKF